MPSSREVVAKALVEASAARRFEHAYRMELRERVGVRRLNQAVASPSAMEEAACDLMTGRSEDERKWALRRELVELMRVIYRDETQNGLVRIAAAKTLVGWMGGDVLVKRELTQSERNVLVLETSKVAEEAREAIEDVVGKGEDDGESG